MRKPSSKVKDPDLSDHYDFSGGVRGKYAKRAALGTSVTVYSSGKPTQMRVSAWKKYAKSETDTDCVFGLNLGKQNRKLFFEGLETVEVEMDGDSRSFSLSRENFWTTCPELRDEDAEGTPIRDWLLRHRSLTLTWKKGHPPKAVLISLGHGQFRLESST